jgi:hypothetical protein
METAWTTLRETICTDIDRWRELTAAPPNSPTVQKEADRLVITGSQDPDATGAALWVTVEKRPLDIRVRRPGLANGGPVVFELAPSLNPTGECRLWLGKDELEFWQASRLILEPILFR